ncbi:MAG: hypothetical protein MUP66_02130 [Candidatus Nanohaloarchaeota archaeon QJJ-5]|nr:hypothetical protein [Candidatus Nanohaloarchaeota archaeon QJJ-5]
MNKGRNVVAILVSLVLFVLAFSVLAMLPGAPVPFIEPELTITSFQLDDDFRYKTHYEVELEETYLMPPANATIRRHTYDLYDEVFRYLEHEEAKEVFPAETGPLSNESLAMMRPSVLVQSNGTYYNLTAHAYEESNVDMVVDAAVTDPVMRHDDPAVISLSLANNGGRAVSISSGIAWPFGRLWAERTTDGHTFVMWTPIYDDRLRYNVTEREHVVLPDVGKFGWMNANTTNTTTFKIGNAYGDIQAGRYKAVTDIGVSAVAEPIATVDTNQSWELMPETLPGGEYQYNLTFTLERTGISFNPPL